MDIFSEAQFSFPYDYKFPGQASNERILFVTRENQVMLWLRRFGVMAAGLAVLVTGMLLGSLMAEQVSEQAGVVIQILTLGVTIGFGLIGWWWVTTLWQKSLVVVTTQRLTKFVYTTPVNRHVLSLPLEMIVDTGSYTKGFLQALFKLGTFTARSSAASSGVATDDERGERINKKYFYIENVAVAEDLQQYINKVLYAFRHYPDQISSFRPFLPHLKGEARKKFMEDYPGYWS